MTETPRRRSREGWIWGSLLAVSLFAGVIGFAEWVERGDAAPEPSALALEPREADGADAPLPEGFVPDLPPIPTLGPGARPSRSASAEASTDERLDQLAGEMRLMQEARGLLVSDAAGALALLDQHRQRYPQGALAEEREVYALEALLQLGQTDQAERRYLEFREDHPTSTFLPRLERAME